MSNSRKQSRLLEKARRLESLRSIYSDYLSLKLEKLDRDTAAASANAVASIERRRAEREFDSLDREQVIRTLTAARKAEEDKLYRELLIDAMRVGRNLSEAEQEKLAAVHRRRLDGIEAKLRAELSAGSGAPAAPAEDYEELIAQAKEKYKNAGESRKTALRRKFDRRISALERRRDEAEARLRALGSGGSSPQLEEGLTLSVKGLKMYFGGVKAVDDLSFDVKEGEIFGLIGPNGAGKTTVFNCITQFYKPTGGTLLFRGAGGKTIDLTRQQVHDVILTGIVRTFQNVEVVPEMSVLENLMVAGHRQFNSGIAASALHLPRLKLEEEVVRARAGKVLEFMGLTAYADMYAMGLPYGILKKIEIARTLMCAPRLIILDEPAAGLNDTETAELAGLIRRIRDEYKCTILLVEHDMSLVMDVCDNICAIAFGRLLAYGTPAQIQADKGVQQAYLGMAEEEGE